MMRWLVAASVAGTAGMMVPAMPVHAQSAEQCGVEARRKSPVSGMFGALGGQAAAMGLGRMGSVGSALINTNVRSFLSDAIACALTGKEAEKAAASTNTALNQGVGGSTTWNSDERKGVTGTTTVIAENKGTAGRTCRTARTIIIVDGEEKSVEQPYCSADGSKWEVATA